MGVTVGVRGWSGAPCSAGLLCFACEGDIGKLSGAPAICWMLGVLCLLVSLCLSLASTSSVRHWGKREERTGEERRGEERRGEERNRCGDWKLNGDWSRRGEKRTEKSLARKIGRDVRSKWRLLDKVLCSNWGKDQVRDDNERLRKKAQWPNTWPEKDWRLQDQTKKHSGWKERQGEWKIIGVEVCVLPWGIRTALCVVGFSIMCEQNLQIPFALLGTDSVTAVRAAHLCLGSL